MIRTLFVEDNPLDMTLILRALKKEALEIDSFCVDSLEGLDLALREKWDLILSDYNLFRFDANEVLRLIKSRAVETPVIVVSSEVSDESAVELMRNGAADFVRKENLSRLAPAIRRELQTAKNKDQQAEQFRIMADSIPQLAWMAHPDGHIYWYNKRWYDYTGTTLSEMKGWGWKTVHNPAQAAAVVEKWTRALQSGEPWEDVFQLKSKTGEYRWFLSRALPLRDAENKITGWFGTNTDINEQLKVEGELKAAKAEAEEANLAKTRFLANMSHEIRTPLGVMMGFAELALDRGAWSTDVENYLEAIKRNGQMLTRIIGEVLDLSKIEACKIEVEQIWIHLPTLTEEVFSLLKPQAMEKGIALALDMAEDLPQHVKTDPTKLRQILINLVGNAIKFTEKGGVHIRVQMDPKQTNTHGGQLKFTVADTGIGISEEQRKKLFKPFSQGDSSMTRKFGGSGLGLVLARELASVLGGDIWIAASEVNVGTTFICTIKNREMKDEVHAHLDNDIASPPPKNLPKRELDGFHILLVEDSADNQILFDQYLKSAGARVEFANDGRAGVDKALANIYDLILMDIQMPILNGHDAVAELRSKGFVKPIVALTAHAVKEERDRAFQEGFTDYLTKPLSRAALIEGVLKAVR